MAWSHSNGCYKSVNLLIYFVNKYCK